MKRIRGIIALGFVLGLSARAAPARADDSTHDRAVAAFQEGRRWIEAGNCEAATTKLRESLSFEPSVGARLSLAECYEKTDLLEAWRLLEDAANLAYINHDDRLPLAESRAAALEKRLPLIKVNVPPSVIEQPGFELRVDGELVDKFHYRSGVLATKPGKHVVEASAPLRHWAVTITSDAGATREVNVQLERDACASTTPPPARAAALPPPVQNTRENGLGTRRTLGLAIAGMGVVGLASGTVFGILTLNKKSHIQDLCGGNDGACSASPGSVDPERESAKTTAAISTASFIVGGAALLGGGVLYFTAPGSTSAAQVRITPRVAQSGGGMGLEGTW